VEVLRRLGKEEGHEKKGFLPGPPPAGQESLKLRDFETKGEKAVSEKGARDQRQNIP
jgi:hypothetical protein